MQRVDAASLELCRELYELSGWKTGSVYRDNPTESAYNESNIIAYKYELGYLIRKLPEQTKLFKAKTTTYGACIGSVSERFKQFADSPEDVAVKLCCELFRQNILKRDNGGSA